MQNHPILRSNVSHEEGSSHGDGQQSQEEVAVNKKRQELSDQLKQISVKIDKEILELRKQNNGPTGSMNNSMTMNSKNEANHSGIHSLNPSAQSNRNRRTDSLNLSQNFFKETPKSNPSQLVGSPNNQVYSHSQQNVPKVHVGPFNTRCLFM